MTPRVCILSLDFSSKWKWLPLPHPTLEEVATRVANPLYYDTRPNKAYYPIFRVSSANKKNSKKLVLK
jgi:hypothetical protein